MAIDNQERHKDQRTVTQQEPWGDAGVREGFVLDGNLMFLCISRKSNANVTCRRAQSRLEFTEIIVAVTWRVRNSGSIWPKSKAEAFLTGHG